MSMPIRILIVAADPVLRAGFRCLLAREPSLAVVGEAANGDVVVTQARTLLPDVILLDLVMPSQVSLETIATFQQQLPAVRILVLSDLVNADSALQALHAGAAGCLLKTTPIPALIQAIHTVARGETPVHPSIASKLIDNLTASRKPKPLSKREREILQLVAGGLSNQAIAETLFLGRSTVHTYTYRLLRKLRVADRAEAARYALETGLITLEGAPATRQQTYCC